MEKKLKEIVIPKDQAVFRLDKNGLWRNKHGKLQHKKIIDFFHASIRKDNNGYHLFQTTDKYIEKVYFYYEDTALFVFDVIKNEDIILVLNTNKRIKLEPDKLFIKDDSLYMHFEEERIKFTERSMIEISSLMEDEDGQYSIRIQDRKYKIKIL